MSSIHNSRHEASGNNTPAENDDYRAWSLGNIRFDGPAFQRATVQLASLREQKRAITEQETDIVKELVSQGHTKRAVRHVIMLEKMDPDDRADFLAEVATLIEFKNFG